MKTKSLLITGLTISVLNASALAASRAYGSNESFVLEMAEQLQRRQTAGFSGAVPRAIQVNDDRRFKDNIKENLPAVVIINVERRPELTRLPLLKEPMREDSEEQAPEPVRSHGSGALITKDGYIVTNDHVVGNAVQVTVIMNDGQEFLAKIVGTDPETDLAVIKIEGSNFPIVRWGDTSKLEIGDRVVAIGSPGQLTQTVTSGIVSQMHRRPGTSKYEDTIQIDAALNPGSSGGPLFHGESGELIGVNNAIVSPNGGFAGVGLTIPAAVVKEIAAALIKSGKIVRSMMGISMVELTPVRRAQLGVPPEIQGVIIGGVVADGPNAKAGIAAQDVIVEFNGVAITSGFQLRMAISLIPPGATVAMSVWRKGQKMNVDVKCVPIP